MWSEVIVCYNPDILTAEDLFRILAVCDFVTDVGAIEWDGDCVSVGSLDDARMSAFRSLIEDLGIRGVSVDGYHCYYPDYREMSE